jgi:kumamolisin
VIRGLDFAVLRRASIIALVGAIALAFALPGTAIPQARTLASFATVRTTTTAYTPADLATAYDYAPLLKRGIDGAGQTVALVEIDGYDPRDLTTFDSAYHLPDAAVSETYIGGKRIHLGAGTETTLDVELLHALAPGAAIQLYYVDSNLSAPDAWKPLGSALRSAQSHGASIVSISLGTCGLDAFAGPTQSALASLESHGISVFVASGDHGDHPGPSTACGNNLGVAYPGADPSVVAVGGTSLHLGPDGTIADETAWRRSGGGRVFGLRRATWQVVSGLPSDGARWAPDVSFDANVSTGVRFYVDGAWHTAGGTSVGAPAWAAAWALVRADARGAGVRVGAAAPLLYAIGNSLTGTAAFHDVTTGSNGAYSAHPGWDAVTGWGSPNVNALATAVIDALSTP